MTNYLKKLPFLSSSLFDKITSLNNVGKCDFSISYNLIIFFFRYLEVFFIFLKSIVFTWSRSSTVLPIMVGHTIAVYNGKEHIPILISNQMIGYL